MEEGMDCLEIIKKSQYYHFLGDYKKAWKVLREYKPKDDWEVDLQKSLITFYKGLDKILFPTRQKVSEIERGLKQISDSIKKIDSTLLKDFEIELYSFLYKNKNKLKDDQREVSYSKGMQNRLSQILKYFEKSLNGPHKFKSQFLEDKIRRFLIVSILKYSLLLEFEKMRIDTENKLFTLIQNYSDSIKNHSSLSSSFLTPYITSLHESAELIFTLGILSNKLGLFNTFSFSDTIFLETMCYLKRGFTFFLSGYFQKAINDYIQTEEILKTIKMPKSLIKLDDKIFRWLSVFIKILKGNVYYNMFHYERAFDYYFTASREADEFQEEELKYNFILAEITFLRSKIFLKMGKYRNSLIWAFQSLTNFLFIESTPKKTRLKIAQKIGILNKYLISERNKYHLINKEDLCSKLLELGLFPCTISRCFKAYKAFGSKVFERIGFILYGLKVDLAALKKYCPSCKKEIVYDWFHQAVELEPTNGQAWFDLELYRLRHKKEESKQLIEDLKREHKNIKPLFEPDSYGKEFSFFLFDKLKRTKDSNEKNLLIQLLSHIDDSLLITKEINKYLNLPRHIGQEDRTDRFIVLRRWSSFSPRVPRPKIIGIKGGGYFLVWNKKGIAIDPGFDFLLNLHNHGLSIADIDACIITHAHIDHTDDLDAFLTLLHERRVITHGILKEKTNNYGKVELFLNLGSMKKYSYLKEVSRQKKDTCIIDVVKLPTNGRLDLRKKYGIVIETIKAKHRELTGNSSIGIILKLYRSQKLMFKIGITGDTAYHNGNSSKDLSIKYKDCDLLVAHIGHVLFLELAKMIGLNIKKEKLWKQLHLSEDLSKKEIAYFLNYEPSKLGHLGFTGVKRLLDRLIISSKTTPQLLVLSEFCEELKPFRHKIAYFLNKEIEDQKRVRVFTGDIGLEIGLAIDSTSKPQLSIRCSKCAQDNDLLIQDTFHEPSEIEEICIQQEEDQIIYTCPDHLPKPKSSSEKEEFIEKFERFWLI
jgi:ribonuclease BN (tRNA processing enzyme)